MSYFKTKPFQEVRSEHPIDIHFKMSNLFQYTYTYLLNDIELWKKLYLKNNKLTLNVQKRLHNANVLPKILKGRIKNIQYNLSQTGSIF